MAVQFAAEHNRTSEYRFDPENITINPDLNGRFDKPEIEWLIADILAHGQHTPVVIRNDGGMAVLVAGFSRWRAVSEINKRGLAPFKMQLRCTYVKCTEAEAFLLNISENRLRNPTTAVDDAHNIKRLLNVYAMTEERIAQVYFPIAKTAAELQEAKRFVRDRIALISLAPEVEPAVRDGRVKESAARVIAKLSQEQQRALVQEDGSVSAPPVKVVTPKAAKPVPKDAELLRRITAMFEDIAGLLPDPEFDYIEVKRDLLVSLHEYVEEMRAR